MNRVCAWIIVIACSTDFALGQASYSSPETGQKVLGSYFATDIDTVNHTNGNLHVNIPLFELPGRELPVRLAVDYNSLFYEWRCVTPTGEPICYLDYYAWRKDTGIGGKISGAKTEVPNSKYQGWNGNLWMKYDLTITWIDSLGSKNAFAKQVDADCNIPWNPFNNPNCYPSATIYDNHTIESTTSDFLKLETGNYISGQGSSSSAVITFKNGNKFDITNRKLRTVNGNFLIGDNATQTAGTYPNESKYDFLPLSDTLGRTISFTNGTTQTITIQDANGQPKTYRITFENISFLPWYDTTVNVVRTIELPNGRTYQLDYSQGFLSKITLPSGAYIRYVYTNYPGSE